MSPFPPVLRRRPHPVEVVYVVGVAALAVVGGVLQRPFPYLLDVVLTLPFGVAALVAVYLGYAVLEGAGGLVAPTLGPGGGQAPWLAVSSRVLDVLLFTAAALAVVIALRVLRHRRRPVASAVR